MVKSLIETARNNIAIFWNNRKVGNERIHSTVGRVKVPLDKNLLIFSNPHQVQEIHEILSANTTNASGSEVIYGGDISCLCCDGLKDLTAKMATNRQLKKAYINWGTFLTSPDCNDHTIWKEFYAENCALLFASSAATDIKAISVWTSRFGHLKGPTPYGLEGSGDFLLYVTGQERILHGNFYKKGKTP